MTMTAETAWAHLPNAKHIDAVLADAARTAARDAARDEARDEAWDAAWDAARTAVRDAVRGAAWTAAWDEARDEARDEAWDAAGDAAWNVAQYAACDALYALIAWDSSADLLDCTPDVLRTMIDLAEPPVCHQAALLLPYAIVRFGQ